MMMKTPVVVAALAVAASMAVVVEAGSPENRLFNCPLVENVTVSDCDPISYLVSAIFFIIPGCILAMGTCMCIPFFYCGRYCCNCCGGSKQTEGYCCGGQVQARYSWFEILRVKIYALIAFVFSVVALSYTMSSTAQGRDGLLGLFESFNKVPRVLKDEVNAIDAALTVTTYNSDSDTEVTNRFLAQFPDVNNSINSVSTDLEKAITDATSSFTGTIDMIMTVMIIIGLVPAVLMGFNLLFAAFNIRRYGPMLTGLFLLICLFPLWMAHSVISPVALISGDICAEIEGLGTQKRNLVTAMIPCPTSLLDKARKEFRRLETTNAEKACNEMNKTCVLTETMPQFAQDAANGRVFKCPAEGLNCPNATFASLLDLAETGLTMHPNVDSIPGASDNGYVCNTGATGCTLKKCASECIKKSEGKLSTTGKIAKQAYTSFKAASTIADVMSYLGAKFYVCDMLFALVTSGMVKPCADIQQGLFNTRLSTGMEAIFCIFAVFVCSWGSKRFIPLSEAGMIQDEDAEAARQDAAKASSGDMSK